LAAMAGPTADHPRVSGEHQVTPGETLAVSGSSPRERGAQTAQRHGLRLIRIIPA